MKKLLFLFFSFIIFISLQTQAQWQDQTSPTTNALYTVSVVNSGVAWIGGDAGTVLRTTDGGVTWTSVGGGAIGTNPVYNIWGRVASTAICAVYDGSTAYMYKTSNGGSTWTQVFSQPGGFIRAIWMYSNSEEGIAYGDPVDGFWELYKTTDAGATWTALPNLAQNGDETGWNNALTAPFVSGYNVYFGTNNNRIYYSPNGGNSWTAQTTTGNTNSYSIWFNTPSTGLSVDATNIVKTTNGGYNWNFVSTFPSSGGSISAIVGDYYTNNWWAINATNMIYYSSDDGSTWSTQFTAPTAGLYYAMAKSMSNNLKIAVRSDGGISTYNVPQIPVELTSFTASANDGNVILIWSTATETNNQRFDIQRKVGNGEFTTVGFVKGNGTTTEQHNYSYIDSKVAPGNYVYRLDQVDLNGKNNYSKEVNVKINPPLIFSLEQNYPNPFNPSTVIEYSTAKAGFVNLSVYSLLGQKVAELMNGNMDAGTHNVVFNASNLPSGMYIYEIRTNSFTAAKKMIHTK